MVEHKLRIAASWEDGQKLLSHAKPLWLQIAIRLQLYAALRHGEILGSDRGNHGTSYYVKGQSEAKVSVPKLKPLTLADFDLEKQYVLVHGKGGTEIYQPVDSETIGLIRKYISVQKRIGKNNPLINCSPRNYRRIIKQLAVEAGVNHPELFSSHTLRAISITYMCHKKDRGAGQIHARHSSPVTTARYDRPTDEMRNETFREVFENTRGN